MNMQGRESVRAPKSLRDLDSEIAGHLIAASADITLVVDAEGFIRDVVAGEQFSDKNCRHWIGRRWIETVTLESRPIIEELCRDESGRSSLRWLHVTHSSSNASGTPVRYAALHIGKTGRIMAVGRDLSGALALQQRVADAQQSLEEEASRLRHAETLFRILFQVASQPVLVVDSNLRVVAANPAACSLANRDPKRFNGRNFTDIFDTEGAKAIQERLPQVRALGWGGEITSKLADSEQEIIVVASMFRQNGLVHYLILLSSVLDESRSISARSQLLGVVENLPDGLVITDPKRRILTANAAFLDFAELVSLEQVRGERLDKWVGRPGVDLDAIATTLRKRGAIQNFATIMRGEHGASVEIEVSAVKTSNSLGFTIRRAARDIPDESRLSRELPRSVEQLTKLVGRVALKELVRETTDAIEKLCIETALELTSQNRASAADLLGLSRQSLYSKLRRFGLESKRQAADLSRNTDERLPMVKSVRKRT